MDGNYRAVVDRIRKNRSLISKIFAKIYTWYLRAFPRIEHIRGTTRFLSYLESLAYSRLPRIESDPEPIDSLEWDNLIILDACRHDIYEEIRNGDVDFRVTVGSRSPEFIRKTFSRGDWSDVVLVAANPFYFNFLPEEREGFFDLTGKTVKATFKEVYNLIETDWCETNSTVMPHTVCQEAIRAEREHPEAPKVIHFMQPHTPHFTAQYNSSGSIENAINEKVENERVWDRVVAGEIKESEVIKGYTKDLALTLNLAEKLADELSGRTLITADHGELLGENGLYSHEKEDVDAIPLRRVPCEFMN